MTTGGAHTHCVVYWYKMLSTTGSPRTDPLITKTYSSTITSALKNIIVDASSIFARKTFVLEAETFGHEKANQLVQVEVGTDYASTSVSKNQ